MMKKTLLAISIASLLPLTASAVEGQVSGFGTIGAASADAPVGAAYDRGLDKSGSQWVNDTKAGVQADVKINPHLSITGQVVAKQSTTDDARMAVQGEWLFGSYAVNDSTKVRAGKLRLPLFMMSEQLDVGKAYTLAKLPLEMYGQAPTNGYVGADVLKSFEVGEDGQLTIQPYAGITRFDGRVAGMTTDGLTKYGTFEADSIRGLNVIFDYNEMLRLRAGYMATNLDYKNGLSGTIGGGQFVGFPLDAAAAMGVHNVDASFASAGAQLRLGNTTITGEYGQRRIKSAFFADTDGRYVSIDHKLGSFTPYVSYAVITSDKNKVVGGAGAPNLDQSTKAAGIVYAVNSNSNVKAEASQVSVGSANNSTEFFDSGMAVAGKDINVYRLNYNLMF